MNQERIYSILKCSFYTNYFKDEFPYNSKYKVFKNVLDKIFMIHLKTNSYELIEGLAYREMLSLYNEIENKEQLLPQQIKKNLNDYTVTLSNILNLIKIGSKIPVFGPTNHFYSHNGNTIRLKNTALYRAIDGEYYSYYFSPYSNSFEVKNDPVPFILWDLLDVFIKDTLNKNTSLTLKVIYIKANNEVDSEEIFSTEQKAYDILHSLMENKNIALPKFDCKEKCKYKNRCKI